MRDLTNVFKPEGLSPQLFTPVSGTSEWEPSIALSANSNSSGSWLAPLMLGVDPLHMS